MSDCFVIQRKPEIVVPMSEVTRAFPIYKLLDNLLKLTQNSETTCQQSFYS